MRFFIKGTPKPQPRPRAVSRGKFSTFYSPVSDWKKICRKELKVIAKEKTFDQAIEVNLYFWFHRPNCHYRTGKYSELLRDDAPKWHTKKPDKDNLEKAVTDAMSDAGLISDDCIIVRGMTSKSYVRRDENSGCWIEINPV